jgi:hypothetical protein
MANERDRDLVVMSESRLLSAEEILEEAKHRARVLVQVLEGRDKPVLIRGERYPEFDDWQTLGRFYSLSCKTGETTELEPGVFLAIAYIVDIHTGVVVAQAEAECGRNDDGEWADRPAFQRRSMAQTRAGAKAFRNCLSWVMVLAGLRPTPAEEMPREAPGEIAAELCPDCGGSLRTGISSRNNRRWFRCDVCDDWKTPASGAESPTEAPRESSGTEQPQGTTETEHDRSGSPATPFWALAKDHWGDQFQEPGNAWCIEKTGARFRDLSPERQWEMVEALRLEVIPF